jgi:hypothetical protein
VHPFGTDLCLQVVLFALYCVYICFMPHCLYFYFFLKRLQLIESEI